MSKTSKPKVVKSKVVDKPVEKDPLEINKQNAQHDGERRYLARDPRPHRLEGTDRVELIDAMTAKVRNGHRKDSKRWKPVPDVDSSTLQVPGPFRFTKEERAKGQQEGRRKDDEWYQKIRQMAEVPSKPDEPSKPAKVVKARVNWEGFPPTGIIRTLAVKGWTIEQCKKLMDKLGFPVKENTFRLQHKDGERKKFQHGPELPISAEQLKRLKAMIK